MGADNPIRGIETSIALAVTRRISTQRSMALRVGLLTDPKLRDAQHSADQTLLMCPVVSPNMCPPPVSSLHELPFSMHGQVESSHRDAYVRVMRRLLSSARHPHIAGS